MAKKPKVLPPLEWLAPRLRLTRALSLAFFFGLIALLVVNNLWFANLHGARVGVILAIELVPLLLLLPGMLTGSPRIQLPSPAMRRSCWNFQRTYSSPAMNNPRLASTSTQPNTARAGSNAASTPLMK